MAITRLVRSGYVVVLYGSRARGDDDALSDCDVLVVGELQEDIEVDYASSMQLSIVRYSWSEFSAMAQYGSLFLWHLYNEGIVLRGDPAGKDMYAEIGRTLPEYRRVENDLRSFRLAIDDCISALDVGDSSVEFELASIATVIRHASILGCYLAGTPEFGRHEPVRRFCQITNLPIEIAASFPRLYLFRISYMRDLPTSSAENIEYAYLWCDSARLLLREVASIAAACPYVSRAT